MRQLPLQWIRRAGAFALATALVAAIPELVTPCAAYADNASSASAWSPGVTIGLTGAPGKAIPIYTSGINTINAKLSIDTSRLSGIATVTPISDSCTTVTTVITCALPSGSFQTSTIVLVAPGARAAAGATTHLSLKVTSDTTTPFTASCDITVADGVDLSVTSPSTSGKPAKAGDKVAAEMAFVNVGNETASEASFQVRFDVDLAPVTYAGCTYATYRWETWMSCPIGAPLAPGESVTFISVDDNGAETEGAAATVEPDAMGYKGIDFWATAAGIFDDQPPALRAVAKKATTGKKYTTRRARGATARTAVEIAPGDNVGGTSWNVANTYDIAAIGSTAKGGVGDVVQVTIGAKNNGPGSVDAVRSGGEPSWDYSFTVPQGTDAVAVPKQCMEQTDQGYSPSTAGMAGYRRYLCLNSDSYFGAGTSSTAVLTLKITQVITDAAGAVSFSATRKADQNPENDSATVVINPSGEQVTTGGFLPVTGTSIGVIAAGGSALVALGVGAFLISRRRRIRMVTPGGRTIG